VTDKRPGNFTSFDYLVQVARAAEAAGFTGLTIAEDPWGEEAWVVAAALAYETPRLRIIPEVRPGFGTAVYAAKLALSFQRFFFEQLGWKVKTGGTEAEAHAVGDFTPAHERLARAQEFFEITTGIWGDELYSYQGKYFQVEAGALFGDSTAEFRDQRREPSKPPLVYLDGETDAELALSARWADVHLFDTADLDQLDSLIGRLGELAAASGRTVRAGLRLSIIAREFEDEAWRKARRLWAEVGSASFDDLLTDDHRWSGFVHFGAASPHGLIGTYEQAAAQLRSYGELGVSTFLLDANPHLEEAYRLGEYLLPKVQLPVSSGAER
jgi:alkanesulfonate monooxygenase